MGDSSPPPPFFYLAVRHVVRQHTRLNGAQGQSSGLRLRHNRLGRLDAVHAKVEHREGARQALLSRERALLRAIDQRAHLIAV